MFVDPDRLVLYVPSVGFEIRPMHRWEPDSREELYVVPKAGWWDAEAKQIRPMAIPCLFDRFAEIEATEEGIIGFANKYGALKGSEHLLIAPEGYNQLTPEQQTLLSRDFAELRDRLDQYCAAGDRFEEWREQIGMMRAACLFWEMLRKGHPRTIKNLADYLRREGGLQVQEAAIEEALSSLQEMHEATQSERDFIRHGLDHTVSVGLKGCISGYLQANESGLRSEIHFAPDSLIAAIWLQLAQAIDQNNWRDCAHCGKGFQPKTKRAMYCSPSCKTLAARKRRERGEQP